MMSLIRVRGRPRSQAVFFRFLLPIASFVGALGLGFYAFLSSEPTVKLFLRGLLPGAPAARRGSVVASSSTGAASAADTASPPVATGNPSLHPDAARVPESTEVDRSDVTLYLPARSDPEHLKSFPASIDAGLPLRDSVARVIALLAAPPDPDALPSVPKNTRVLSLFVSGKSAWVNLSRELVAEHPGGMTPCRMTVYSIVNTLVEMGVGDEIRFLVAGREQSSFLDHMDLSRPLVFEESVMRRAPSGAR